MLTRVYFESKHATLADVITIFPFFLLLGRQIKTLKKLQAWSASTARVNKKSAGNMN